MLSVNLIKLLVLSQLIVSISGQWGNLKKKHDFYRVLHSKREQAPVYASNDAPVQDSPSLQSVAPEELDSTNQVPIYAVDEVQDPKDDLSQSSVAPEKLVSTTNQVPIYAVNEVQDPKDDLSQSSIALGELVSTTNQAPIYDLNEVPVQDSIENLSQSLVAPDEFVLTTNQAPIYSVNEFSFQDSNDDLSPSVRPDELINHPNQVRIFDRPLQVSNDNLSFFPRNFNIDSAGQDESFNAETKIDFLRTIIDNPNIVSNQNGVLDENNLTLLNLLKMVMNDKQKLIDKLRKIVDES